MNTYQTLISQLQIMNKDLEMVIVRTSVDKDDESTFDTMNHLKIVCHILDKLYRKSIELVHHLSEENQRLRTTQLRSFNLV